MCWSKSTDANVHCFKDTAGRDWPLTINVNAIRRVRAKESVDLAGLFDEGSKPLAKLLNDPCRLVDVLWVLIEEEADKKGIKPDAFGASMGGDALEAAAEALVEEILLFFPSQRARSLRKLVTKGKAVASELLTKLETELDRASVEEITASILSSGDARASSASTPESLRSAS
jgi:hypothetical protein